MLIDYLIGAALAISGMLTLLVFGTDIIHLNTEAREYWQAQSAMADFVGRKAIHQKAPLTPGRLCEGGDPQWVASWCDTVQVISLPKRCVSLDHELSRIVMYWGSDGCSGDRALTASRQL